MKARQPAKQIHLFPYWKAVETVRAPVSWIKSLKFFKKKNLMGGIKEKRHQGEKLDFHLLGQEEGGERQ